jgi:hypothetical protein
MTEFRIEPVNEVIVNDLHQDSLDNFLYSYRCFGITTAIWVDGIIIQLVVNSKTKLFQKYDLIGKRLYEQIIFVKYPEYTKTVKSCKENYEIALRNYNNFPRFRELVKWIKSQPIWKEIPEGIKMKCSMEVNP